MKNASASGQLAALGHDTRLAVFRLLVQAGAQGVKAGAICAKLGMRAPTLSFHLAYLTRARLIKARQEGRFIFYAADYARMDDLLSFLTANCCQGAPCLPKTSACAAPKKRGRAATAR